MATVNVTAGTNLNTVAASLSPGDTVILGNGTHTGGRVDLRSNARNTRWVAANRRLARVHGFNMDSWNGATGVTIEALEITNSDTGFYANGISCNTADCQFIDNHIHDCDHQGIWVNNQAHRCIVRDNLVELCSKGIVLAGSDDCLVEGNRVNRPVFIFDDADYMRFFGRNHVFRHNLCYGMRRSDIGAAHTDGWQTWGGPTQNILFEDNVVWGLVDGYMISTDDGDTTSISNITIRNNVFIGSSFDASGNPITSGGELVPDGAWGVNARGGTSTGGVGGIYVEDNIFIAIQLFGVGLRYDSTGTIKRNIFYNVGYPYMLENNNVAANLDIRDNVIWGATSIAASFPGDVAANPNLNAPTNMLGADTDWFTADDGWVNDYTGAATPRGPQLPYTPPTDVNAPVITLAGSTTPTIPWNGSYTEAGYSASDVEQGDLTSQVVITDPTDPTTVGAYVRRYNVYDGTFDAAEKTRTITVQYTGMPVITLIGPSSMILTTDDSYSEAGATATDAYDASKSIAVNVVVGGDTVDTATPGTYIVTYNATNSNGVPASEVTRTVEVRAASGEVDPPKFATAAIDPALIVQGSFDLADTSTETYFVMGSADGDTGRSLVCKRFWPQLDDAADRRKRRPLVLFLHNVDTTSSSASGFDTEAQWVAEMGCVAAVIETRIQSDNPYDAAFDPVSSPVLRRALRAIITDAERGMAHMRGKYSITNAYAIEQNWIFLAGFKCGGIGALCYPQNWVEPFPLAGIITAGAGFGLNGIGSGTTHIRTDMGFTEADHTVAAMGTFGGADTEIGSTYIDATRAVFATPYYDAGSDSADSAWASYPFSGGLTAQKAFADFIRARCTAVTPSRNGVRA